MQEDKLAPYVERAVDAKECFPDVPMEVTWLDAVPFDKHGNPTGEKNEYVVHRFIYTIADGIQTERAANALLDYLQGKLNE